VFSIISATGVPVVTGENAGQDAHRVGLAPLRGEARLAGLALVKKALDVRLG
jgi:hypothetical protein